MSAHFIKVSIRVEKVQEKVESFISDPEVFSCEQQVDTPELQPGKRQILGRGFAARSVVIQTKINFLTGYFSFS